MPPSRDYAAMHAEDLALLAGQDDKEALGELYERHADLLFRYVVTKMRGDRAAAEDVAADAWMKAMRGLPTYRTRGEGSFRAWLVTIARCTAIDYGRRGWTRHEIVTQDMLLLNEADTSVSPHDAYERQELAAMVEKALRRLIPDERRCVQLRHFQGLTIDETAQLMGKTPGAVKVLQHRALKKLATVLPEQARTTPLIDTEAAPVIDRRTA